MTLRNRHVTGGRITRVYEKGGIFLPEPGETLAEISSPAISHGTPAGAAISKCLLCDASSIHYGLFMTREEAIAYTEGHRVESTGDFFGLCEYHNPHEKEDEVCDAVYKILEDNASVEEELDLVEAVIGGWLEQLVEERFSERECFQIMLSLLQDGKLTLRGHEFSEKARKVMKILLESELRKRSQ